MRNLVRLVAVVALVAALVPAGPAVAGEWPASAPHFAIPVTRVAGADRYATSAQVARAAYPGWAGVNHVLVASGDTRALADPLASGSLCWAYDAPLLLVSARRIPPAVATALAEIASANPTVTVTVVGGPGSVPAGRLATIRALVPSGTVSRPWSHGDRFQLARAIASRTRKVAAETGRAIPSAVFLANGVTPAAFFDALSASAASANSGVPVLLTRPRSLPAATAAALAESSAAERVVVGGTGSVSKAVAKAAHATGRWAGATRWATSAAVARNAALRGWGGSDSVVLFATVPDGLSGAALAGRTHAAALVANSPRLAAPVAGFLASPPATLTAAYVLGGTGSVSAGVANEVAGAPAVPVLSGPRPVEGSRAHAWGAVGSNTTTVTLQVNGAQVATRSVAPFGKFDFGTIAIPKGGATVRVTAINPDGKSTVAQRRVKRMVFPYSRMILIVKHEFRLYWINGGDLVKSYPIATGRLGMETPAPSTWKVLAKYKTDPGSVYGPRKMRLFRQRGGSYVYTAYGIHGTNQPWVIGTKASHGCIRLYNHDILDLWPRVPLGTMVLIKP